MNAPFDFSLLETFDFRKHYEKLATRSVLSVVRHRWLIAKILAGALLIAALLVAVLPRRYTAEALVQPQLFSRGVTVNTTALASIDGAALVASEAALIQSPAVARAVVKRLGLEQQKEFARSASLIGRAAGAIQAAILPETVLSSPTERATHSVRAKLTVTRDTRSYLISIEFTAASPEKAAQIANAFALEYVNAKVIQRLSEAVSAANRELTQSSATFGENHPSYMRAIAELDIARQRLQTANNRHIGTDLAAGEGINLAEPTSTPSSPNGSVILGLAFVLRLGFRRLLGYLARTTAAPLRAPKTTVARDDEFSACGRSDGSTERARVTVSSTAPPGP